MSPLASLARPLKSWGFHGAAQLQDIRLSFLLMRKIPAPGLATVMLKVIREQSLTIPCLSALLSSACSDTSFMGFNHFLCNAAS